VVSSIGCSLCGDCERTGTVGLKALARSTAFAPRLSAARSLHATLDPVSCAARATRVWDTAIAGVSDPETRASPTTLNCSRARTGSVSRQLPATEVVGLSVGLPSFALPARKSHVPDVLLGDFLRRQSSRKSEGLNLRPLTPGLADGQPVPPTTSGPVGHSRSEPGPNQAHALLPTLKAGGFPRCYRCDSPRCSVDLVQDSRYRPCTVGRTVALPLCASTHQSRVVRW
jgi:hypothetical protein